MKKVRTAQENRQMVYEVMKSKKGYNPKKFDRKLYEETAKELGVFAYGKVVGTYEEDSKKPTKKTSRGSSSSKKPTKKAEPTLEARVDALEDKIDKILELLSK